MTIVAITLQNDQISCFTDSRITREVSKDKIDAAADTFPKVMLIPFRVTAGNARNGYLLDTRGEFGYAYVGDVVFATGLHSMCANMFANMHADEKTEPPTLNDFADCAASLANILHERVFIYNREGDKRPYTALLFGQCPKDKVLKAFQIEFDRNLIPQRFSSKQMNLIEGAVYTFGTGAATFKETADNLRATKPNFSITDVLVAAITSGNDKTIGGAIQQCISNKSGTHITPIIMASEGSFEFHVYVGGVCTTLVDPIDGFTFGREAVAYGVEERLEEKWLHEHGFSTRREDNPTYVNEQARLMVFIKTWSHSDKPIASIDSKIRVISPKTTEPGKSYFFTRCAPCNRPTPILEDPTDGKFKRPFFGVGGFIGECIYCHAVVQADARQLQAKTSI